jgi:long-chain acyl-CoA synthetase
MSDRRSLLARGWRVIERELSPRADDLVETSQFARAVGLVTGANALARRQAAAGVGRVWHLLNLPTAGDVARLRRQVGALDRELRTLTLQLERQAARDERIAPGNRETGMAREDMETTIGSRSVGAAEDAPTITEALRRTAANHPDIVAIRTADDGISLTWRELLARIDAVAGGLAKLGVGRGDAVAIMLNNRPEFHLVDYAALTLGATPFSIYQTYPAAEVAFLVNDSGARLAIVEQAFLPVMLEARKSVPALEHVIVVDGDAPEETISLADVEGSNPGFDATAAASKVTGDDIATLIYTSGTTGRPKGVEIPHRALMCTERSYQEVLHFNPGSRFISWLPAAHIAERNCAHYIPVVYAGTTTCAPNPREIVSFLPQVRPDWFFAVPRIWEKMKAGVEAKYESQPAEERRTFREALDASIEKVRLQQRGAPVPEELADRVAEAVVEFFHAIGIDLGELWGMSESTAIGTVNRPGAVKIGTVGPPAPNVELKLADDGEVLVRGDFLMAGYRNSPEKTAEAFDPDGWLRTGDVGTIDDEGYLTIVDRKKEIMINAAGKNMSPTNIEAALKSASPLIGQACSIGDRRSFVTALIVLDADYAPEWAAQQNLEARTLEELASEPKLTAAVQAGVDEANQELARVEQVKRFTIIPGDWGADELTPTMKLKRKPIEAKYEAQIEAMYQP